MDTFLDRPLLSARPLFQQIRDHFLKLIASGEWAAGRLIGSEIDLAGQLGVSVGTVRKALDSLESDGLVTRRQGRGTQINDQTSNEHAIRFSNLRVGDGRRLSGTVSSYLCDLALADLDEQQNLKLSSHDSVFRCVRVREHNGHKFMYERVSIAQRIMPNLAKDDFSDARVGVIGARKNGILLGEAQERVDIALATQEIAEALSIPVGKPLLRLDRVLCSIGGRPLEWRLAHCDLSDKYYMADMS